MREIFSKDIDFLAVQFRLLRKSYMFNKTMLQNFVHGPWSLEAEKFFDLQIIYYNADLPVTRLTAPY